MTIATNKDANV